MVIFPSGSCHCNPPEHVFLFIIISYMEAYCSLILMKGKFITKESQENAIYWLLKV